MQLERLFLSCDWGTSSFRLRLVDASNRSIHAEESNSNGNASLFEQWKQTGQDEHKRIAFYQAILSKHITEFQRSLGLSLKGLPVIISGMASSTVGMLELPYKNLPFSVSGSDLHIHKVDSSSDFPHDIFLISGVRSEDDVMRGEEIQLIGSRPEVSHDEQLYIFPGTHSKHILVKGGSAIAFATYMTGEVFSLLSTRSILLNSVSPGAGLSVSQNAGSFAKGVTDSRSLNPLHSFFRVRTNILFDKFSKEENFYYLSGLLIGAELKDLIGKAFSKVVLVSNDALSEPYRMALKQLEICKDLIVLDIDQTILEGHSQIYQSTKAISADIFRR
jgi:2-dehydro-3-deoxygalactonokinase